MQISNSDNPIKKQENLLQKMLIKKESSLQQNNAIIRSHENENDYKHMFQELQGKFDEQKKLIEVLKMEADEEKKKKKKVENQECVPESSSHGEYNKILSPTNG